MENSEEDYKFGDSSKADPMIVKIYIEISFNTNSKLL